MFRRITATSLQKVEEPDQIGIDVSARILDRVTDPRLRRQMNDDLRSVFREKSIDRLPVRQIPPKETERREGV